MQLTFPSSMMTHCTKQNWKSCENFWEISVNFWGVWEQRRGSRGLKPPGCSSNWGQTSCLTFPIGPVQEGKETEGQSPQPLPQAEKSLIWESEHCPTAPLPDHTVYTLTRESFLQGVDLEALSPGTGFFPPGRNCMNAFTFLFCTRRVGIPWAKWHWPSLSAL